MQAKDVMVMINVSAADCIVDRDNHGGYIGGTCIVCKQSGWATRPLSAGNAIHKKDCPVRLALEAAGVTESAI